MINVYLIQLATPQLKMRPYDLQELKELALQVGLNPVESIIQHLSKPSAAFGVGKGKLEELKERIVTDQITMIVFYNELSNTQLRNLEFELGIEVIDRTMLVLELLSQRATTTLAKKLVAITQMRYMLPRLSALTQITDRQQGGIGLKGPGETALELNRRVLEKDIAKLQREIKKEKKVRVQNRKLRQKKETATVSLVGYTNAGKSTLLNAFLDATHSMKKVLAKNQLFATLDTQSRRVERPLFPPFIISDTVGFISHMPAHLKASFIATLEEITTSQLILIVLDASNPYLDEHVKATEAMLDELAVDDIPKLYVLNKMDAVKNPDEFLFYKHPYVTLSLHTLEGFEHLELTIKDMLFKDSIEKSYMIPYAFEHMKYWIKEKAWIHTEKPTPEGTLLDVKIPRSATPALKTFEH